MLFYPQVSARGAAQYPLVKTIRHRSIAAETPGGRVHRSSDTAARLVVWDLVYSDLTAAEAQTLSNFFESTEGRLKGFVFVDPMANLLGWSEELDHAAWLKGPMLGVTTGASDPFGGTAASHLSNGGLGDQSLMQALPVVPGARYCVSAWVRCGVDSQVWLTAGGQRKAVRGGAEWIRETFSVTPQGEPLMFGITLGTSAAASVYGMQVEAQVGASDYKRNPGPGGVYTEARFDQDELVMNCDGPDQFSARVRVVAGRQE